MTSSSTDLLGSGVVAFSSVMKCDQAVAASRGVDERRPEAGLELVEPAAQREQRRVDGRVRRVVAEQAGLDEVACGGRLGALGEKQDEGRLLLGEASLRLAQLDRAPGRVEDELAEAVGAGTPCAALDQPRSEVGVDVGHGHVALDE